MIRVPFTTSRQRRSPFERYRAGLISAREALLAVGIDYDRHSVNVSRLSARLELNLSPIPLETYIDIVEWEMQG